MTRKIIAIGGGENGRIKNGIKMPYETFAIDSEIVKTSGKSNPNFLVLAHALPLEFQQNVFDCMSKNYSALGCNCKLLTSDELSDIKYAEKLLDWADIIYEHGGNTAMMLKLWCESGFDKLLENAYKSGKVLCGVSAGANCWFEMGSTDSDGKNNLTFINGLNFVKGLFVPHCDDQTRMQSVKKILKQIPNTVAIAMSNCAAIAIIDNTYKIILGDGSHRHFTPYALKAFIKNGEYFETKLSVTNDFQPLTKLYDI